MTTMGMGFTWNSNLTENGTAIMNMYLHVSGFGLQDVNNSGEITRGADLGLNDESMPDWDEEENILRLCF